MEDINFIQQLLCGMEFCGNICVNSNNASRDDSDGMYELYYTNFPPELNCEYKLHDIKSADNNNPYINVRGKNIEIIKEFI